MDGAELHFHLLPGVDDGPADMADTLELAREAIADGTSIVVATPHVRDGYAVDTLALPELVANVRTAVADAAIPLEVHCGGELAHELVGRLGQHELQTIAHGPAAARWLLVEAPFEGMEEDFHAATEELRDRGFGIVIAHPERSADALLDGSAGLRRELELGALVQVNAMSLVGSFGDSVRDVAFGLIADGHVSAISSDAHGPTRPPALTLARAALHQVDPTGATAHALTCSGPRRLLVRGVPQRTPVAA